MNNKFSVTFLKNNESVLFNTLLDNEKESIETYIQTVSETSSLDEKQPYVVLNNLDNDNIGRKIQINELENIELLFEKLKIKSKKSNKKSENNETNEANEANKIKKNNIDSIDDLSSNEIKTELSVDENILLVKIEETKSSEESNETKTTPILKKKKSTKKVISNEDKETTVLEEKSEETIATPVLEETKTTPILKKKKSTKKVTSEEDKEIVESETVQKKKKITKKIDIQTTDEQDPKIVSEKKVIIRTCSICKSKDHDRRKCPHK